jgi:hypothetical protein
MPTGNMSSPRAARTFTRRLLLLPSLALVGLALFAAPASAAESRLFQEAFGPDGTSASQFEHAAAIGVDSSSGATYVADKAAGTVQKFNAAHEPEPFTGLAPNINLEGKLTGFGFSGTPAVSQVAVDSTSHDLFVAAVEGGAVKAFQPDGEPADFTAGTAAGTNELAGSEPCGVAVDPNGAIYVSFADGVHVFASTGEELTKFAAGVPCNLAVDSHGNVYAAQFSGGVEKVAPTEKSFPVSASSTYEEPVAFDENKATGVAVDPSTDNVFVDEAEIPGIHAVPNQVAEYDSTGKRLGTFAGGGEGALKNSEGLAVNGATQKIYVSDTEGEKQVGIFVPVPPPAPVISGETASNLTATSADLSASVNPGGQSATCSFEYGTSTGYGTSFPCGPQPGEGKTPVAIAQHLAGLEHDKLYHWRVVATNPVGTTTGPDHTFIYTTTTEPGGLPDNRAYEMVTPPVKNAALIGNAFLGLFPGIAADGSRLTLAAIQCFGDAGSCSADRNRVGTGYAFSRTPGGWVAHSLAPPVTQFPASTLAAVNPDTGAALISAPTSPHGQDDWYARQLDGTITDIGPVTRPELGGLGPNGRPYATADLSHVIAGEMTNAGWPFEGGTSGAAESLLEWTGSGLSQPVPVGVSGGAGSTNLVSFCATGLGARAEFPSSTSALSADGETVFFTARRCIEPQAQGHPEVPADEVYARLKQSETVKVSASQCGQGPAQDEMECRAAPPAKAEFQGASVDGSKAFFMSPQRLTDNASEDTNPADKGREQMAGGFHCSEAVGVNGCNLYEYDFSRPPGQRLETVSAGDTSGRGPRVQGAVAISNDGARVYFVARGVLSGAANGAGATAKPGAPNLYLFERDAAHPAGVTTFIATLLENDQVIGADRRLWEPGLEWANVSSDGRFLVFDSSASLTRDDTRHDGVGAQVFRYDSVTNALARVSIGEGGFNDNGNAGIGNAQIASPYPLMSSAGGSGRRDATMSDNGQRVFFMSPVALTPHALNDVVLAEEGTRKEFANNVYEWEQAGAGSCPADHTAGCVSLISNGRDVSVVNSVTCGGDLSSVCLIGTDLTGSNVFFTTADQLVPGDTDTQVDFYDARVCEPEHGNPCVTASPQPLPPCSGEACHGVPPATPGAPDAPSATFNGTGNLTPPPPPVLKPLTNAQKLAKALKACRTKYKHSKKRRGKCEKEARHKYAAKNASVRRIHH